MTTGPIRPLGVGEVLDAAIRIYRRRFKAMVIATAITVGPALLVSAVLQVSTAPDPNAFGQQAAEDPEALDLRDIWVFLIATLIATLIALVASQIATGATLKSASGAYFDEPADWRGSLRFAIRKLPSMLWVVVLTLLATLLGIVACVLPGIWIYVATSMVIPVVLLENLRGTSAVSRSWRLVEGRWWATFGTLIIASLLAGFVAAIFAIPGQAIGMATGSTAATIVLQSLGSFVGSVITTPFSAAVTLVIYVDLRVRKEAFDLELLAGQLGVVAPEGGFARPDMPGFEMPGYGYPAYPASPEYPRYPADPNQPAWGPPPGAAPPTAWGPPVPPPGAPRAPGAPTETGWAGPTAAAVPDRLPAAPPAAAPSGPPNTPSPWAPPQRPPQPPLPPVAQGLGPTSASPPPPLAPPAPQPLPPPEEPDAADGA